MGSQSAETSKIRRLLRTQLPDFEISIGGTTSIDVTRKGVDKTLCVKKLKERLGVERKRMLFVGDALFRGGNDYIMKSTGIRCICLGSEGNKGSGKKDNLECCFHVASKLANRSSAGSKTFFVLHDF